MKWLKLFISWIHTKWMVLIGVYVRPAERELAESTAQLETLNKEINVTHAQWIKEGWLVTQTEAMLQIKIFSISSKLYQTIGCRHDRAHLYYNN